MSEKKPISDKALAVCNGIIQGISIEKSCADNAYSTSSFYAEMRVNEELEKEYLRARESRAHTRFENMQAILDECRAGLIDPNTARVLIDAIKWQTGKEKAKVYGDSTILRGDKENPLDIGLANLLDAAASRRALPAPEVIEGEIVKPKVEDFL